MTTKDIGPKNPVQKGADSAIDFVDERSGVKGGSQWLLCGLAMLAILPVAWLGERIDPTAGFSA